MTLAGVPMTGQGGLGVPPPVPPFTRLSLNCRPGYLRTGQLGGPVSKLSQPRTGRGLATPSCDVLLSGSASYPAQPSDDGRDAAVCLGVLGKAEFVEDSGRVRLDGANCEV